MANQITDGRTLVHAADAVTPYDDLSGAAAGTLDTEIFIQGTGSIGEYLTSTLAGLLYDAGSAQNWSSNVFYIWINCGIVGLLDTKANGGMRIRFCGATVTDWFEVYVAGSDDWPPSVQGGWTQFVVDIETARADAVTNGWTNGTVPATSAIRYVGWAGITAGTMPRMVDNTWMDEIRRLPDGSPGIIVEGRNAGTTDWDSADIFAQLGTGVGTFIPAAGGGWKINTPIQFGINDTTTHGFTDTNAIWLWDNQEFLPDDVYAISALGNSGGTTNVTLGVETGTGDDATGAQGLSISAAADGARWAMDFNDPDLDTIGLYGCSFAHGATFDLDDAAVNAVSCIYNDVTGVVATGGRQVRCQVVAPNTADGVGFMTLQDLDDIAYCSFEFADGHAITLVSGGPATQPSTGNLFSGFGANDTNDAALYNNRGSSVTVNVGQGGDTPTVRTVANTTVNNTVDVVFNDAELGSAIYIEATATVGSVTIGDVLVSDIITANPYTYSHDFEGNLTFDFKVLKGDTPPTKKPVEGNGTISSTGFTQNIVQADDGA